MLILTRRAGETIQVGDDITITVTHVSGGQVRIAIDAPKNVAVDRSEIRAAKLANPSKEVTANA